MKQMECEISGTPAILWPFMFSTAAVWLEPAVCFNSAHGQYINSIHLNEIVKSKNKIKQRGQVREEVEL